jgi:hypothetical protein
MTYETARRRAGGTFRGFNRSCRDEPRRGFDHRLFAGA